MSGWWIKLNDSHIRMDRREHTAENPWTMAECLVNLFDVPSIVEQDDEWSRECTES